jgi:alkanesulfonate monooxygenase SsuD/methylene tetrahydromethanopterin reductase-like flavin-dependent oxidoreductase (luciferase family)
MAVSNFSVGLTLASRGVMFGLLEPADLVRMAEVADQSGLFDAIWTGDSLIANPRLESVTLLAAVAARTRRIRLGAGCMASLVLRDPVLFATQWASLDMLSSGRTTLIACAGNAGPHARLEAEHYQLTNAKDRYRRLVEIVDVLRLLWSEDDVTYEGEQVRLRNVSIGIRPPQKPGIPIWIASDTVTEQALRRVARRFDGWMTSVITQTDFGLCWNRIETFAREEGRNPELMGNVLYYNMHITEKPAQAYEESKKFLAAYYGREWSDEILNYWLVCGTAEQCAERLREWMNSGLRGIALRFTSWDQFGQLERCIEEVLPMALKR